MRYYADMPAMSSSSHSSPTNVLLQGAHGQTPGVARGAKALGVTPRSLALGLLFTVLTDFWIHWAELVMGGVQGHTAIAATSTPVGPFCILFMVAGLNILCRAILPGLAMSGAEMLVVYSMITTSATLSSSGQLHFIIPTVTAAWHYATDANGWASAFHRFVPDWVAQKDPIVLDGFYKGQTVPPWGRWLPQMGAWIGFMLALSFASLCIVSLLRRQWVDRERLAFPTVALPLELMETGVPIFRKPLFWIGFVFPCAITILNTIALNAPTVPLTSLRADLDLNTFLTQPPLSAIGPTRLSYYPFVIGIAYLIPVDVTFSCWFFFFVTRAENILSSALNLDATGGSAARSSFPFLGQQGAGAFLGLTLVSLWLSRGYLKDAWNTAFGDKNLPKPLDDTDEPLTYRGAFVGLALACVFMVGFCVAGGMQPLLAVVLIFLALCYMIAATRIRAETGNAWLFGPEVDVNHLMTRTFGTGFLTPQDLTMLAFMRPAAANFDFRCSVMPHQFDAMKMADAVGASRRRLFGSICVGTVIGLVASFMIALSLWHGFGAEGKTDAWRTSQGKVPFDTLVSLLRNPVGPDIRGIAAIGFGFAVTAALIFLRSRFVWWPLHPVGYALAGTNTLSSTWLPFFAAWLIKVLVLRYGGAGLYRRSLPFFLGLIAGDLFGGGMTTALGAFTGINVYPVNW